MMDLAEAASNVGTFIVKRSGLIDISCGVLSNGFPKTSIWSKARAWKETGRLWISLEDRVRVLYELQSLLVLKSFALSCIESPQIF